MTPAKLLPAVLAVTLLGWLCVAAPAGAVAISNGTVTLGVNPQGDLNSTNATGQLVGVTYNATGNDGTRQGLPAEGWGAGAAGSTPFQAHANEYAGNSGYVTPVTLTSNTNSAVSVVDILRGDTPALRLRQDFHPSPTTPNLYEITTTLENISGGPLTDVRYERVMDWDVEPTATNEYVTINRGTTPPASLRYSDDQGFGDTFPFSARALGTGNGPIAEDSVNTNYVDKGPDDHGARFTFSFGTLAAGEAKTFFLYYGAAGTEVDANSAVSAAALEVFSYGQPNVADGSDPDTLPDGPAQGKPNTFIWGFRAVGGRPVIPPTLTLSPGAGSATVGASTTVTGTLLGSGGSPVPGAKLVFTVAGANPGSAGRTTDGNGQASVSYSGANAGTDTITGCLDSNDNGACDAGEVTATATRSWAAQAVLGTSQEPTPVLGQTVVAAKVGRGTVLVRRRNGRFRRLGAREAIPLGSEIDATRGRVRLTSAAGPGGAIQTADFYQGAFVVTQTRGTKPVTQLRLSARLRCSTKKGKKAQTSAKAKKVRRLWGDGKGRFRTRGRRAAATVRGTKWLTEDRCDSTRITVRRGVVTVRDLVKKKNRTVRQGHSYTARIKKKK